MSWKIALSKILTPDVWEHLRSCKVKANSLMTTVNVLEHRLERKNIVLRDHETTISELKDMVDDLMPISNGNHTRVLPDMTAWTRTYFGSRFVPLKKRVYYNLKPYDYIQISEPVRERARLLKLHEIDDELEKFNKALVWVQLKIRYVFDSAAYNESDYHQLPSETLVAKQGDCEDVSYLVAALFIAGGGSPQNVFVGFGEWRPGRLIRDLQDDPIYHAWTFLYYDNKYHVGEAIMPIKTPTAEWSGDMLKHYVANWGVCNAKAEFKFNKRGVPE